MRIGFKVAVLVLILALALTFPIYAIGIGDDTNGNYLTDDNKMTLYYFVNDDPYSGISNCYGNCQSEWHPIYEEDRPKLLKAEDFGTITRTDGSLQTTYKGRPLYRYEYDLASGDKKGSGKYNLWYIMRT